MRASLNAHSRSLRRVSPWMRVRERRCPSVRARRSCLLLGWLRTARWACISRPLRWGWLRRGGRGPCHPQVPDPLSFGFVMQGRDHGAAPRGKPQQAPTAQASISEACQDSVPLGLGPRPSTTESALFTRALAKRDSRVAQRCLRRSVPVRRSGARRVPAALGPCRCGFVLLAGFGSSAAPICVFGQGLAILRRRKTRSSCNGGATCSHSSEIFST